MNVPKAPFKQSYNPESQPQLFIDQNFRVWLMLNNAPQEVKMTPLCKALYFLFLQHPEGISLYDLYSYRQELMEIYKRISRKDDYHLMQTSIDFLVNKYDNSIHEKISRIKHTFSQLLTQELAQQYYIKGKRRQEKTIAISRELVKFAQQM